MQFLPFSNRQNKKQQKVKNNALWHEIELMWTQHFCFVGKNFYELKNSLWFFQFENSEKFLFSKIVIYMEMCRVLLNWECEWWFVYDMTYFVDLASHIDSVVKILQ